MRHQHQRILNFDRMYGCVIDGEICPDARRSAAVIDIQNVADYIDSLDDATLGSMSVSGSMPNIAPPFTNTWLDFNNQGQQVGILVSDGDIESAKQAGIVVAPDAKWLLAIQAFVLQHNRPHWVFCLYASVSECGALIKHDNFTWQCAPSNALVAMSGGDDLECLSIAKDYANIGLLAICFMHCKNVVTQPAEVPAKLSKAWNRKHNRPLARHYVLDINPMKHVLRTEGGIDEVGLKQALHICRGHFKTYTPDRPLFGRTTGTFWWPMTVRGHSPAGVVTKDYRVLAPKKEV